MEKITHKSIVALHRHIAATHKNIKGFYRFDWSEISGRFRAGVHTPALLLESHSTELDTNGNNTTTMAVRRISFLLLDFTGKPGNYEKQETVLDDLERVTVDICSYLKHQNGNKDSFLYGKFDPKTVAIEKVGPIFDNMYGWNVLYTLKNHEPLIYDPEKWTV